MVSVLHIQLDRIPIVAGTSDPERECVPVLVSTASGQFPEGLGFVTERGLPGEVFPRSWISRDGSPCLLFIGMWFFPITIYPEICFLEYDQYPDVTRFEDL